MKMITDSINKNLLNFVELNNEQYEKLKQYEDILLRWQPHINLVAKSTLPNIWVRHFADSLQLLKVAKIFLDKPITHWLDIGSGAGFPGLVIAIGLTNKHDALVELIESDERKAAFLRTVVRELKLPAKIYCERIEDVLPNLSSIPQIISARALAPLCSLIDYCEEFIHKGSIGIFPQGINTKNIVTKKQITDTKHHTSFIIHEILDEINLNCKIKVVIKS